MNDSSEQAPHPPAEPADDHDVEQPSSSPSGSEVWSVLRARWRWLLGALVAALLGYGAGRVQGAFELSSARERAEEREHLLLDQQAEISDQHEELRLRFELLRARRFLDRAVVALSEHNYGLAQQRATAAAELLKKDAELAALGNELGEMNYLRPGESEKLTGALRDVIRRFDEEWDQRVEP